MKKISMNLKKVTYLMLINELSAAVEQVPELGNNYPISEHADSESFVWNFIATIARQSHRLGDLDPKSECFNVDLLDEIENEFSGHHSCILPEAHALQKQGLLLAINIFASMMHSECGLRTKKKQVGNILSGEEYSELIKLRKENKQLRIEKEKLKKVSTLLVRECNKV
jgi:hypothetical protein